MKGFSLRPTPMGPGLGECQRAYNGLRWQARVPAAAVFGRSSNGTAGGRVQGAEGEVGLDKRSMIGVEAKGHGPST